MLQLLYGCTASELKVHPQNWNTTKASVKVDWYLYYRFYDPSQGEAKYAKGKLVIIKGMNSFKTLTERQVETKRILEEEQSKLLEKGYNPITKKYMLQQEVGYFIAPSTGLIVALNQVKDMLSVSPSVKRDLKSIMRFVNQAAIQLGIQNLAIKSVSRRHIKAVLSHIEASQEKESAHRYNKIRTYLMMLFKELVELEAVEYNPVKDISKKETLVKLRQLLSLDDRKRINEHLFHNHYRFWLFVHIFFHSGARLTELMKVRAKDVNLDRQEFVVVIKKGKQFREVEKPIKDIALSYWQQMLENAAGNDFLFSKNLCPGLKPIGSFQITKRWNRYIKKDLGISEDFYSLKHLNLDQIAESLSLDDAAAIASHTTTVITAKHYAVNEKRRQQERLKRASNKFSEEA